MTSPHTHGGTDAPECTTCREVLSAVPTSFPELVASRPGDAVRARVAELAEQLEPVLLGYHGGLLPQAAHIEVAQIQAELRTLGGAS